jgi:hypothetical protein
MPPSCFNLPPELYNGKKPNWIRWDEAREWWYCVPCRKFTDDNHVTTDTHVKNLRYHAECKQYQDDHKLYALNRPEPPPPPPLALQWPSRPPPPPPPTDAVQVYRGGSDDRAAAAAAPATDEKYEELVERMAHMESRLDEMDRAFDHFVDRFFTMSRRLEQFIGLLEGRADAQGSSSTASPEVERSWKPAP